MRKEKMRSECALIGPLKVIYYHAMSKVEIKCQICDISYFDWMEGEAKTKMLEHLDRHWHPQPEYIPKALEMPGR